MDEGTFSSLLKRRRRTLDLTQAELGRRAGCSEAAIRKIEAGERRPSRQLARLLADVLGIPAGEREFFIQLARGLQPEQIPSSIPQPVQTPMENLPSPLTSLIDRVRSLAALRDLLRDPSLRWLSLIGPPGIGKTRLCIQCGRQALDDFPDGVWFLDLSPIEEVGFVLPALGRCLSPLGLHSSADLEQIAAALKDRRLLLILDNFEHVPAAAVDIASLLKRCAGLKVLATSRVPLHIYGEHEYPVPGLALPPAGVSSDPAALLEYESVQLFAARVRQHLPDFAIDARNAAQVARVCTIMEGMPLALELAAATLRTMPLDEMAARLGGLHGENWVRQFGSPARDLPSRQRTLEQMVDWSWWLLDAPHQSLFSKLSVFAGWFNAPAVYTICLEEGGSLEQAREGLRLLADQSLLVRGEMDGVPCWRMLEIIHEYATLRLEAGLLPGLKSRHAKYFQRRLETVLSAPQGMPDEPFFQMNLRNLHAALGWFIAEKQTEHGFQVAERLSGFWSSHGYFKEGLAFMQELLALPDGSPPSVRATRLELASDLAWQQHDFESALVHARAAAELGLQHALKDESPAYFNRLARIHIEQGDLSEARATLNRTIELLAGQVSPRMNPGVPLAQLGEVALMEGRLDEARELLEKALELLDEQDAIFISMALTDLAEAALAQGEYPRALTCLGRGIDPAGRHIRRTLAFLCAFAGWLVLAGQDKESFLLAAGFYAAVEALGEQSGVILSPFYRELNGRRIEHLRRRVSASEWQAANFAGRQWDRETAFAQARRVLA